MSYPLIITEEFWANSHLSIARYYGQIKMNDKEYVIVNKEGKDIFELSEIAEKEGKEKAIEPGEPCDLCLRSLVPSYRKLGRDRILELIREYKTEDEIKAIAFPKKTRKKKKQDDNTESKGNTD